MTRAVVSNKMMFSEPGHRTIQKDATFIRVDSGDSMKSLAKAVNRGLLRVGKMFWPQESMTGLPWVVQWLRIHLLMQVTWVRALVWEDLTCHGATEPVSHNY